MKNKVVFVILLFLSVPSVNLFAIERTVNVALTSNYVFRGLSQTDDKLAIQATYHATQFKELGWYAGLFSSNVTTGIELDLYGGYRKSFGRDSEFAFDVGAVEYIYSDSAFAKSTLEIYGGISYFNSSLRLFLGENERNYFDFNSNILIDDNLNLELHYGLSDGVVLNGNDLSATFSMDVRSYLLSLALSYEDVTLDSDVEFFVTVSKSFDLRRSAR